MLMENIGVAKCLASGYSTKTLHHKGRPERKNYLTTLVKLKVHRFCRANPETCKRLLKKAKNIEIKDVDKNQQFKKSMFKLRMLKNQGVIF